MASQTSRKVAYDTLWGACLALSCVVPMELREGGGALMPWNAFLGAAGEGAREYRVWLACGSAAGLAGLLFGLFNPGGRTRHAVNMLLGAATTWLLMATPAVKGFFPYAHPDALPMQAFGSLDRLAAWAAVAIYSGCGMRLVRPSCVAGHALAGLAGLLMALSFFLPGADGSLFSRATARLAVAPVFETFPYAAIALAACLAALNFVRSPVELFLARSARLLLVAGMLSLLAGGLASAQRSAGTHWALPHVWGAVRFLGPLFLCLDGAIALLTVSLTRGAE